MWKRLYKSKQFVTALKVLWVLGALWYVYQRLNAPGTLGQWQMWWQAFQSQSAGWILGIIALSVANRYAEIVKWHDLLRWWLPTKRFDAARQVLAALSVGLFTPNGLGEYLGKAMFFKKKMARKIIGLNIICNGYQACTTGVFAVLGAVFLGYIWPVLGFLIGLGLLLLTLKKTIALRQSPKNWRAMRQLYLRIPVNVHLSVWTGSLIRYACFSHQMYFLLQTFQPELPYLPCMAALSLMYATAAVAPSLQLFDVAVKGGLALYWLSPLGPNAWVVMGAATVSWLLNTLLPVSLGGIFLWTWKPQWTSA